MLIGFANHNEAYRDRTAAIVPYAFRRKQCACGKVVTAKQLTQYGKCAPCAALAAAAPAPEAA